MTDLDRTKVTFEQAEGLEALPSQLKPTELTKALRARLWAVLNSHLNKATKSIDSVVYRPAIQGAWVTILYDAHVTRWHLPADEFDAKPDSQKSILKPLVWQGSYGQVYGLLQSIIRHRACPRDFSREIAIALQACKAGYRLDENSKTLIPVASEEEAAVVARAFAALNTDVYSAARKHLITAAERLTAGDWPGSIRESIHAVESIVRVLTGKKEDFSKAIASLEARWSIHGALGRSFRSLYGYTSDEPGIRHPLVDDEKASVDEADALFMFGACSAFVTYLIERAKSAKD
jgi:hypothetical protein